MPGWVDVSYHNGLQATMGCMHHAVAKLEVMPAAVLIDGPRCPWGLVTHVCSANNLPVLDSPTEHIRVDL